MLAAVFRLNDGHSPLKVPRGPVYADVRMIAKRLSYGQGSRVFKVEGAGVDEQTLPSLHDAKVTHIGSGGLVIEGYEIIPRMQHSKSNVNRYRQVWWVILSAEAMNSVMTTVAKRRAAPSLTGFDDDPDEPPDPMQTAGFE
jgi:hypothetical protein